MGVTKFSLTTGLVRIEPRSYNKFQDNFLVKMKEVVEVLSRMFKWLRFVGFAAMLDPSSVTKCLVGI